MLTFEWASCVCSARKLDLRKGVGIGGYLPNHDLYRMLLCTSTMSLSDTAGASPAGHRSCLCGWHTISGATSCVAEPLAAGQQVVSLAAGRARTCTCKPGGFLDASASQMHQPARCINQVELELRPLQGLGCSCTWKWCSTRALLFARSTTISDQQGVTSRAGRDVYSTTIQNASHVRFGARCSVDCCSSGSCCGDYPSCSRCLSCHGTAWTQEL